MNSVYELLANLVPSHSTQRRRFLRPNHSRCQAEALEVRSLLTSLIGADVTVQATVQSNTANNGVETPNGRPESVIVQESVTDPELEQFGGLYDIDIDTDSITFVYDPAVGSGAGVVPAGTFYRYYFDVDGLPSGDFVASATAATSRNLVPNVSVVNGDQIVVEIGPGMQLGTGFDASIIVETGTTPRVIEGVEFEVSNTFQSPLGTSGVEIPVGSPVSGVVSESGAVISQIGKSYDLRVMSGRIEMDFNPAGDNSLVGVVPAGTFDRIYVDFDLRRNEFLSTASARTNGQTLVPNVIVVDEDTLLIEVGPGMQVGSGFDAVIDFDVGLTGSQVSGRTWQDLDNDGRQSGTEDWLTGWEIQLLDQFGNVVDTTFSRNIDLNGNGVIERATEAGLYVFEGVQNGFYEVQQKLPAGWIQTAPLVGGGGNQQAYELDQQLGLVRTASHFPNWGGRNEKWVLGEDQWYFITPDGAFYRWDGSPRSALTGTLVANVDPGLYDNLALLYDARPPGQNLASVTVPNDVTGLDFGSYLAPPNLNVDVEIDPSLPNDVTFSWNETFGDDSAYELWISSIATRRRFQVETGLTGSSFSTIVPDGRYRAWIRSEYSPGVFSAWSRVKEFELVRNVSPIMPNGLNPGIDATPVIEWVPQTGAVSYDLRVTSLGGDVEYLATQINTTTHRVATTLQRGTHLVSIRSNYADGSRDSWSFGQELNITGQPVVQVVGTKVSWTPVTAATHYEIWMDRVDQNGNALIRQVRYDNDVHALTQTFTGLPQGLYSVWVRAIRAEGGESYLSLWSERVDFRLGSATDIEPLEQLGNEIRLTSLEVASDESESETQRKVDEVALEAEFPIAINAVSEKEQRSLPVNNDDLKLFNAVMAEVAQSELLDFLEVNSAKY